MDSVATAVPPRSEEVVQLLSISDGFPIRMRERTRLIKALGFSAHTEWSRVELKLDAEELERLAWSGQSTTPYDLAHICGMAQTVARMYGSDYISTAHVAVALAASSRQPDSEAAQRCVDVVSEAFNLGELEGSFKILHRYLEDLETDEMVDVFEDEITFGFDEPWASVHSILPWIDPTLRVALCVALCILAGRSDSSAAWVLAFAVLIPIRDNTLVDSPGVTRLPVALRSRWPSLIVFALIAVVSRLWAVAALLIIAHIVLELVAVIGEYVQARFARADGPAIDLSSPDQEIYVRALRLPMRYPVRDRALRFFALAGIGAPIFLGIAEVSAMWPAFAVVYLLSAHGRSVTGLIAAVTIGFAFSTSLILLLAAWAIGLFARLLSLWLRRIGTIPIPVGFSLPRTRTLSGTIAVARARRLLTRGQASTAVRLLDAWFSTVPHDRRVRARAVNMLRAWALLESGRPGAAWDMRDEFPHHEDLFRTLIVARAFHQLGNDEGARLGVDKLIEALPSAPARLGTNIALLSAEVEARGAPGSGIARLIPTTPSRRAFVPSIRLLRLAGTSLTGTNPALGNRLLIAAQLLGTTSRRSIEEGTLVERGGIPQVPEIESARADVTMRRSVFLNSGVLSVESFAQWRYGCQALFRLGNPLEVANEMNAMADALADSPDYRRAALECRIDGLAALNSVRHEMTERTDRRSWWAVYGPALHQALSEAHRGKDWALLAELIESARIQGDPHTFDTTAAAPYIRVRGRSAFEASFWQKPESVPATYDLEAAAAAVLGSGSWWWSTWTADGYMYWSLCRPDASPLGGRLTTDELAPALAALRDALPIPFPGEDSDELAARVAESPILVGPISHERDLMRSLGALIPEPLRAQLLVAPDSDSPLGLVIAPAAEYGHVPWASIIIDAHDGRLIEHARIAVAPPVALLATIASRPASDDTGARAGTGPQTEASPLPVRGAVVNPGGDLEQARQLLDILPTDTDVLTDAHHPDVHDFAALLGRLPTESTFVFAGHTAIERTEEARAVLSLGGSNETRFDRLVPLNTTSQFPRTVLLLACGSGDLQNASAGEWSTLGPSVLWAGASRAIVTSFPIPDSADSDRQLVEKLDSVPVHQALHEAQNAQLQDWRESHGELGAPGQWAGHIGIGAFTRSPALNPHVDGPPDRWISDSVFTLVDSAAELAVQRNRDSVTIRDLWDAAHTYFWGVGHTFNWGPARYGWVGSRLRLTALSMFLRVRNGRRLRAGASGRRVGIDQATVAVLAEASKIAVGHHHPVLDADHVFHALLRRSGATASVSRALTGLDPRGSESLAFLLERESRGWETTGIPSLDALSVVGALSVYDAAKVNVQLQWERWFFTDRPE